VLQWIEIRIHADLTGWGNPSQRDKTKEHHMPTIQTIMVAVDFSKFSLPTAEYAVQLARELEADLLFVNIINQRDIDAVQSVMTSYTAFNADEFISGRLNERHRAMDELIQRCHADPSTTRSMVRIGVPYLKLLEVIDETMPDLLVMAAKGRSDLADVVMGSCARSMYRRSPIPMLSIRGDKFFNR
jgi:nucleotide-binding universal stress UspA family protein